MTFLANCIGHKSQAMEYLEFVGLTQTDQYRYLQQSIHNEDSKEYEETKIKLMIYDFSVLTYWPLNVSINELRQMSHLDLTSNFGGKDRIQHLGYHFRSILLNSDEKPMMLILSQTSPEVTREALARIKLGYYFEDVISCNGDAVDDIIGIKDHYDIFTADEVLYIPNPSRNAHNLLSQCSVYGFDASTKPLRGISPANLAEIRCIIKNTEYESEEVYVYDDEYCLSQRDKRLFGRMLREIRQNRGPNKVSIDSLSSMIDVTNNDLIDWRAFGHKYHRMRQLCTVNKWKCCYILSDLLKFEWNTAEIWTRYGPCLSYLGHEHEAEYAFKKALKISPTYFMALFEYGYHSYHIGMVF